MKYFLLLLFLTVSCCSIAQNKNVLQAPRVDERVELLSIVFRLAACTEYSSEVFSLYTDKIKEHYQPFKDHELIRYLRKIRKERGIGYDGVMRMAVHIDNHLNPMLHFSEDIPDSRWGKAAAVRFLQLLKKFYTDTKSNQFFKANRHFYQEISDRFLPVYKHLDVDWYASFYGKELTEEFIILIAPGNGGANYGVSFSDGNQKTLYAIMGVWQTDNNGMAQFNRNSYFPTLLHEFNHSFINSFSQKYAEGISRSAQKIFDTVKTQINKGGYGNWQTMFDEALVRAAVIKYMKDHHYSAEDVQNEMEEQQHRGFIWIEDLVKELENYDQNRNVYPTLQSYLPKIEAAYINYAEHITAYINNYRLRAPRFMSISEFDNGDQNVTPSLKQLTINFDKPFSGVQFIKPGNGEKKFPKFKKLTHADDKNSVILEWDLESNKEYQFVLTGVGPRGQDDYTINFKTQ